MSFVAGLKAYRFSVQAWHLWLAKIQSVSQVVDFQR